ncbi:hypothetical protein Glove_431g11 [Diversispora epigaea]|uniref:Uncharacterized protein n=1 Tax=Diversispora epigaea TaxID=1348612 RepID=A0A397GWZ5_9GLOM|nr:hypothetical protein Glove_431g11 [Diversispora epigaea]
MEARIFYYVDPAENEKNRTFMQNIAYESLLLDHEHPECSDSYSYYRMIILAYSMFVLFSWLTKPYSDCSSSTSVTFEHVRLIRSRDAFRECLLKAIGMANGIKFCEI